ncbi:MAG: hypothetical protein GX879_10440, partial [Bacteroidales bacterium]|nr:hypothetical protein [Bacteroidales bacterium]
VARYSISNNDIGAALDKYHLSGFSEEKVLASKNYQKYKKTNPDKSPFDYFAEGRMGFSKRHHVTPFPPSQKKIYYAESSLDLAVRAVENAFQDSGVQAHQIGAWFVSTVSPHEQAPGMAATLKAYLLPFDNTTPSFSLASGCAGFNINIERACEYLDQHKEIEHVAVVHSETMSSFLTNRIKFIPFVTFGDGAAAVILSRKPKNIQGGILNIVNYHDSSMLDFVGVDKNWNLYMDDSIIKERAVENIPIAANEVLKLTNWSVDDIDVFVPHQTGNAILLPVAQKLNIPKEKVFLEEQLEYGNTSGASVPISLSMLNEQKRLKPGMKILSGMAGVGGNYGAFTYEVPREKISIKIESNNYFKDKNVLLFGSASNLSKEISENLLEKGANIKLAYFNDACPWKTNFNENFTAIKLVEKPKIENFIKKIEDLEYKPDYLIFEPGIYDNNAENNFLIPLQIIKSAIKAKPKTILLIGSLCETTNLSGYEDLISSLRALHGAMASASGELLSAGIRLIYYMPGFAENDFLENINENLKFKIMINAGQEEVLKTSDLANRIVKSLIIPKTAGTWSYYENAMVVRCDGYKPEVDV